METKEPTNGTATRTDKFELLFDVSATHISRADYHRVAVSAILDSHRGCGNGFRLDDLETDTNACVKFITYDTVTDSKHNFKKVKMEVSVEQEYHTDIPDYTEADQVKTPAQLITAMENQLGSMTHYYRTSYDEGDIATVSLDSVSYTTPTPKAP